MQVRKNKNILFFAAMLLSQLSTAIDEPLHTFQDTEVIGIDKDGQCLSYEELKDAIQEGKLPDGDYQYGTIPIEGRGPVLIFISSETDLIKDADSLPVWVKYLYSKRARGIRNSTYYILSGVTVLAFGDKSSSKNWLEYYIKLVGFFNLCIFFADCYIKNSLDNIAIKEKVENYIDSINHPHLD